MPNLPRTSVSNVGVEPSIARLMVQESRRDTVLLQPLPRLHRPWQPIFLSRTFFRRFLEADLPHRTPALSATPSEPIFEFVRVAKSYGRNPALVDVSFSVARGEFFSLLGPSGCGKTTTLRLLAGLEDPDSGEIRISGRRVNEQRPYERKLGMVFQSYALFPHLSVSRNISFGLERRRISPSDIPGRIARALEMVRLDPGTFARRMPSELSGGQRQRVALARAIVLEPEIVLLDEPLGALDLKLRREMQSELRELNRRLGVTFLYVTHDQEEALGMSDRIAVMDHGRIAQLDTPQALYENPRTTFVATFLGESSLLEGTARRSGGTWVLERADGSRLRLPAHPSLIEGGPVKVAVRPERLSLADSFAASGNVNRLAATVQEVVYVGDAWRIHVTAGSGESLIATRLLSQGPRAMSFKKGDSVEVHWLSEDTRILEDA
jgi:putative spermidine/putrescine transport system ATP-binding protein